MKIYPLFNPTVYDINHVVLTSGWLFLQELEALLMTISSMSLPARGPVFQLMLIGSFVNPNLSVTINCMASHIICLILALKMIPKAPTLQTQQRSQVAELKPSRQSGKPSPMAVTQSSRALNYECNNDLNDYVI